MKGESIRQADGEAIYAEAGSRKVRAVDSVARRWRRCRTDDEVLTQETFIMQTGGPEESRRDDEHGGIGLLGGWGRAEKRNG